MKQFLTFLAAIFMFAGAMHAQNGNYIKHKVAKSETITQIAKKYRVTPSDIYRLNPDSQRGISENDIILIPGSTSATTTTAKTTTVAASKKHTVQPKETLFSIARDYSVTVDDLRNANAHLLGDGLKMGQEIVIPGRTATETNRTVTSETAEKPNAATHVVAPGQTKFSIAKQYGISVAELERQNPEIISGLPAGYVLKINGGAAPKSSPWQRPQPKVYEVPQTAAVATEINTTVKKTAFANYEVKPQETLYSLSQMFGIAQEELISLNPGLKEGVKIGMILKVPGKGSIVKEKTAFKDLTKTLNNSRKRELVMLLPFNASKINGDSTSSTTSRLKSDAFLNMTLDFYSGALMAIDSARALGMNVNVRIFDSQENKSSSNVATLIKNNNFKNADAVIGPFYQQHSETTASLLQKDSIPVISPLSKETGTGFSNLYQSMPPADYTKRAIMNYMISKNGNIIVISDPKKLANKEFISTNFPSVRFAQLSENGGLMADNLRAMLVKDRTNYIVIDSEKTGMILSTTNLLLNEMANYKLQLAIIEQNETLDFEEISMKRLTILKMLYPSLTRENATDEARIFENSYKEKNKIFPSPYATRGFDVTFDTLLRISQDKTFTETVLDEKTQQIESKFNYAKTDGAFINKGIYILHYDEDLTVKEAE